MTSSTSPLLATLLLSHPLFSIPPGQTLSITLFSSILSLPLLFPRSVSLLSCSPSPSPSLLPRYDLGDGATKLRNVKNPSMYYFFPLSHSKIQISRHAHIFWRWGAPYMIISITLASSRIVSPIARKAYARLDIFSRRGSIADGWPAIK